MNYINQFGPSFCYCCNPDIIDVLTIPMARPSIAYDVYVPRFCHRCSNINSPFFVSKINIEGKPYHKLGLPSNPMNFIPNESDNLYRFLRYINCLNSNIDKPLSFEEKYICKRVYLPIQDKYYNIENYHNMFGHSDILFIQYRALHYFKPYIINGLNIELVVKYNNNITSFLPEKIIKNKYFLSKIFGNFGTIINQTNKIEIFNIVNTHDDIIPPKLIVLDFPKKITL